VDLHPDRLSLRLPGAAGILEVPHQLFLFGVYGNDRLAVLQKRTRLVVQVADLHRPFRGRSTFLVFPIGLQTVAQLAQQAANGVRRHPVSPPGQGYGQVGLRFGRPPQHVRWTPSGRGLHYLLEDRQDFRMHDLDFFAPTARASDPSSWQRRRSAAQLRDTLADRRLR